MMMMIYLHRDFPHARLPPREGEECQGWWLATTKRMCPRDSKGMKEMGKMEG